jgi:hypothetical protein
VIASTKFINIITFYNYLKSEGQKKEFGIGAFLTKNMAILSGKF